MSAEEKTNPGVVVDPAEQAFIRVETRLNELYAVATKTLDAVLALAPRVDKHDDRLQLLEAKVKVLESQVRALVGDGR